MKKFAAILFSAVYLLLSAGVLVSAHYCSDKIASVSFYTTDVTDCCGDEQASDDCCHNETHLVKLNDEQNNKLQTITVPKLTLSGLFYVPVTYELSGHQALQNISRFYTERKLPPLNNLYLTNSVWRI